MTKTADQLLEDYSINKKKKTLREWEKKYNVKISLEDFDYFKENKLKYLEVLKIEKSKEKLRQDILDQLLKNNLGNI